MKPLNATAKAVETLLEKQGQKMDMISKARPNIYIIKIILVLTCQRLVVGAAPSAVADETPWAALAGYEFYVAFLLSWPETEVASGVTETSLYYKVVEVDTQTTIAEDEWKWADDDGNLKTSLTLYGLITNQKGTVALDLQLSDSPTFPANSTTSNPFTVWVIIPWLSLLPLIVLLLLAVITQDVIISLFAGIYTAAIIINQYNPIVAFQRTLDSYILGSLSYIDNTRIVLIVWILSGLAAVMQKSGGADGLARSFQRFAKGRMSGQLATVVLSLIVFSVGAEQLMFVIGPGMRQITDVLLISREKLAQLLDSTCAPIASTFPLSAWISYEIGLIEAEMANLAEQGEDLSAYETNGFSIFINSLASRYYPYFLLWLIILNVVLERDMGPMLWAERRAVYERKVYSDTAREAEVQVNSSVEPEEDTPKKWWNAVLPLVVTMGTIFTGIALTGVNQSKALELDVSITNVISNASIPNSILWGAFFGSVFSWLLFRVQYKRGGHLALPFSKGSVPLLHYSESFAAWLSGIKEVMVAVLVLIEAWTVSFIIQNAGAGQFISAWLSTSVDSRAIPVLTFLIASIMSTAIGTSWGTMAILFPIAIPSAYHGDPGNADLLYITVSAVLAGATFGDHCTLISDTTVYASVSAKCDIRHHVLTQLPLALTCGIVSALIGYLPAGYALWSAWVGILVGFAVIVGVVILLEKNIKDDQLRPDLLTRAWWTVTGQWSKKAAELELQSREYKTRSFDDEEVKEELIGAEGEDDSKKERVAPIV